MRWICTHGVKQKSVINALRNPHFYALFHLQILHQSQFAAWYTFVNKGRWCQLKDFYPDKRKCDCDAVKIGILKAMENEKNSSKTNCSKILDRTSIASSINYPNTVKHSLAENRRFSRGFNHIRFDRNVILTSIFKTIEDPLEIGKNELDVSLSLRAYKGHCYSQILSIFIIT